MNAPVEVAPSPAPVVAPAPVFRVRWFMIAAWAAILVKCAFVSWAVEHWHMPFRAGWVVWPTIAFAALATVLWLTHHEDEAT